MQISMINASEKVSNVNYDNDKLGRTSVSIWIIVLDIRVCK